MNLWQRYRALTLACLLFLLTLVILTLSVRGEGELSTPGRIVIEILGPLQKGVMAVVGGVDGLAKRYVFLVETAEENLHLRQEVTELRQKLVLYEESHLANQRLRRLLEFKEHSLLPLLAAEVVALDSSDWFKTVLLDKGSRDGVSRGMAVVNDQGVVGRVIEVSYNHCRVLLLIDRNSGIDALIQRSRTRGILKGSPLGPCRLEFVIHNADVQLGDMIITSGLAGVFPKGMILGRVSRIKGSNGGEGMFQTIEVTPAVDFDRLEEAFIILKASPLLSGEENEPKG